jgi:hypothetical protein
MDQVTNFESYQTAIDTEDMSASTAVIRTVAAVTNQDPLEMKPLYDVIDPDALNNLFAPSRLASCEHDLVVEFSYNGCSVRLSGDCSLRVLPEASE